MARFLSAFLLFCSLSTMGKPIRYEVRDAVARNVVQFISDAPLDRIVGLSNSIVGWIELDPDRVSDGIRGEFEVDVRTFETGIALRNDQIRDKFLGAGEFPFANFSILRLLTSEKNLKLVDQKPLTLRVEGTIKIKGVSKPLVIPLRLVYFRESESTRQRLNGNLLKVSGVFPVDLPTFNLGWSEALRLNLARAIQVTVDVVGTDTRPTPLVPTPLQYDPKMKPDYPLSSRR